MASPKKEDAKPTKNTIAPVEPWPEGGKEGFTISPDTFYDMIERKSLEGFEKLGGCEGIRAALQTDPTTGVTTQSLDVRRRVYGANKLPPRAKASLLGLIWDALKDTMVRLLIVAAVVSIVFGMTIKNPHTGEVDHTFGWVEGTAVLVSVCVVVGVGAGNDYQKAKKFEELEKEQSKKELTVIRDGEQVVIDSTECVTGDLLLVENGQTMDVDAVWVSGQDLTADESAATGEGDVQKKNATQDPFFLSGTNILEGRGFATVVAVGENSFSGKLTMATRGEIKQTPLQDKLAVLADRIGKAGLGIAIILVVTLTTKEIVRISNGSTEANAANFLGFVLIAIAVVVVAIPEGLPLAVTIALAYSMKAMMKDNCLVRVLASCETMGAATAICSDKTGTLTKNQMTTVQGWIGGEEFVIEGTGISKRTDNVTTMKVNAETDTISGLKVDKRVQDIVAFALAVNSTAELVTEDGKKVWKGNKTEQGLLGFVYRLGYDFMSHRGKQSEKTLRVYPFSSAKKRMSALVRGAPPDFTSEFTLFVKGASEMVLADCTRILQGGEVVPIGAEKRMELENVISSMAQQGNRTIGLAYEEDLEFDDFLDEEPRVPLVLLAVFGIQDPIRPEVPLAVERCNTAGITVRMVTGDNIQTAIAISHKCGIFTGGSDIAMQGPEFREMAQQNPEQLKLLLPRLRVLARSSPTDKHTLVGALMELGEVVGVTGDGTNDAPALSLANVGFAMNSGTEIAKGASAMIIRDDNFATVVKATMWGRAVNDNIRKFLQFQLTVNFVGVLLTFVGAAVSPDSEEPLKAVQLLWLNLIMDTFAALSLATEKPSETCLQRPPVFKSAPLISNRMWSFIGCHSVFQFTVMMVLLYFGHQWFGCDDCGGDREGHWDGDYCRLGLQHNTVIFNTFIWFQVFNEFNARSLYGELNCFSGLFTRSRMMCFLMVFVALFQVMAVQFFGRFMSTTGLTWQQWLGCLGIAGLEFPVGFAIRFLPVPEYVPPPNLPPEIEEEKQLMIEDLMGVAVARWKQAGHVILTEKPLQHTPSVAFKRGDRSLKSFKRSDSMSSVRTARTSTTQVTFQRDLESNQSTCPYGPYGGTMSRHGSNATICSMPASTITSGKRVYNPNRQIWVIRERGGIYATRGHHISGHPEESVSRSSSLPTLAHRVSPTNPATKSGSFSSMAVDGSAGAANKRGGGTRVLREGSSSPETVIQPYDQGYMDLDLSTVAWNHAHGIDGAPPAIHRMQKEISKMAEALKEKDEQRQRISDERDRLLESLATVHAVDAKLGDPTADTTRASKVLKQSLAEAIREPLKDHSDTVTESLKSVQDQIEDLKECVGQIAQSLEANTNSTTNTITGANNDTSNTPTVRSASHHGSIQLDPIPNPLKSQLRNEATLDQQQQQQQQQQQLNGGGAK